MRAILLLSLLFISIQACDFTRDQVLDCIKTHVDVNQDGKVTRGEIHYIVDTYGSIGQRIYFTVMNGMNRIFSDCDYDKNGVLTVRDFTMTEKTCFAQLEQRCNMEKLCAKIK